MSWVDRERLAHGVAWLVLGVALLAATVAGCNEPCRGREVVTGWQTVPGYCTTVPVWFNGFDKSPSWIIQCNPAHDEPIKVCVPRSDGGAQ